MNDMDLIDRKLINPQFPNDKNGKGFFASFISKQSQSESEASRPMCQFC